MNSRQAVSQCTVFLYYTWNKGELQSCVLHIVASVKSYSSIQEKTTFLSYKAQFNIKHVMTDLWKFQYMNNNTSVSKSARHIKCYNDTEWLRHLWGVIKAIILLVPSLDFPLYPLCPVDWFWFSSSVWIHLHFHQIYQWYQNQVFLS